MKMRKTGIKTWLKGHTQAELAQVFGKTQPWVAHIVKSHPNAMLTLDDGQPVEMTFLVQKSIKVKR